MSEVNTNFNEEEFNKFIIENDVVGFFETPITLKSGRQSYWYANCRNLSNSFKLISKTAEFLLQFLKKEMIEFDYIYGVPEGATKLAIIANYKIGEGKFNSNVRPEHKIIMGRGMPKTHGAPKDKYFIGEIKEGDKVLVLEDVTTTGGSLLKTIKQLKEANVEIVGAIGIVNRMEKRDDGKSVEEAVNELGVPYFAMSHSILLLPMAKDKYSPSPETLKQVEFGFDKHGLRELKFE
jgi:orotate phosphoribosyltransferase